jgi:hypothetical protein
MYCEDCKIELQDTGSTVSYMANDLGLDGGYAGCATGYTMEKN